MKISYIKLFFKNTDCITIMGESVDKLSLYDIVYSFEKINEKLIQIPMCKEFSITIKKDANYDLKIYDTDKTISLFDRLNIGDIVRTEITCIKDTEENDNTQDNIEDVTTLIYFFQYQDEDIKEKNIQFNDKDIMDLINVNTSNKLFSSEFDDNENMNIHIGLYPVNIQTHPLAESRDNNAE